MEEDDKDEAIYLSNNCFISDGYLSMILLSIIKCIISYCVIVSNHIHSFVIFPPIMRVHHKCKRIFFHLEFYRHQRPESEVLAVFTELF